jgi:hypothetical protein
VKNQVLSDEDADKLREALAEDNTDEVSTTADAESTAVEETPKPPAKPKAKAKPKPKAPAGEKPLENVELPPKEQLTNPKIYDDGIVVGTISTSMGACDVCGSDRRTVLLVHGITLPPIVINNGKKGKKAKSWTKNFKPHPSLIFFRGSEVENPQPVKQIGITCGCLVKGHRQLARIDQRIKDKAL